MSSAIDITGKRFGRLTVVKRVENRVSISGRQYAMWLCKCDCGKTKIASTGNLRQGQVRSCGCLQKDSYKSNSRNHKLSLLAMTHGETKTHLYMVWSGMKRRCQNPHTKYYPLYGGRGVRVCDEWQKYEPFRDWAHATGYKQGLTIDRIDCDGDYCPENCRWITFQEQQRNRRNNRHYEYQGKSYTVLEIAKILGMKPRTVQGRIERGWSIEKIFSTPVLRGNGKSYFK